MYVRVLLHFLLNLSNISSDDFVVIHILRVNDHIYQSEFIYTVPFLCFSWVKVFRINPEFRILRLTLSIESQPQSAELWRL